MLLLHCKEYSQVCCSLQLVNFGLMITCSSPVQFGQNIIESVQGQSHKIHYFQVRSGQKFMGHYGVGCQKTLPHRTVMGSSIKSFTYINTQGLTLNIRLRTMYHKKDPTYLQCCHSMTPLFTIFVTQSNLSFKHSVTDNPDSTLAMQKCHDQTKDFFFFEKMKKKVYISQSCEILQEKYNFLTFIN